MLRLFGRKRGIAIAMVAILVFTLLPVDLNWADESIMISENEVTSTEETTPEERNEEVTAEPVFENNTESVSVDVTQRKTENSDASDGVRNIQNTEEKLERTTVKPTEENIFSTVDTQELENQKVDSYKNILDNTTIDLKNLRLEASYKDADGVTQVVDMKTTESVELPIDASILMNFNFVLGDGNAIDCSQSYVYDIPDGIRVDVNATHELSNANGESIGQVVISSDGTMTFTFYEDKIKNQQAIPFYVRFEGGFSSELQENQGETQLSFPTASGEFTYNVDVKDSYKEDEDKEPGAISTYKSGTKLVKNGKPYIQWTIGINPNGRDIVSAEIIDNLPEGLIYIGGSATLSGEKFGSTGTVTSSVSGQRLSLKVNNSQPNYHTTVTFLTKFDEDLFGADKITNDTVALVDNAVAVNPDDGTASAEGSTQVRVTPNVLSKSGSAYNSEDNSITWTITINADGYDLGNAVYSDTFGEGLTYKDGSITISPAEAGSFETTEDGFTFTPATNYRNQTIVLTYTTTVDEDSISADKFTNQGILDGNRYHVSTSATVDGVDWIRKTCQSYNDITKQFTWTIVVNEDNLSLTNAVVTESFNTNNMKLVSAMVSGSDGVAVPATMNGNDIELGDIDEKKTITVVTQLLEDTFEIPAWQTGPGMQDDSWYSVTNTAILKTGDKEISAEATYHFHYKKPDLLEKDGVLTGDGTVLWTLKVKYQNLEQKQIVISDILPDTMEYVPGTFRLQYEYFWDANTQQVYAEPEVQGNKIAFTLNRDTFDDSYYMNHTFVVKYETKLKDQYMDQANTSSVYTNNASVAVTYEGDVVVEDTATKTVEGTVGGILGKEYAYFSSNDYVDWTVAVNEAGYDMSAVANPIIKDKLADYFDYVSGTLYKTTGGIRTEVPASDYVVVVVNNLITVKLPNIGTDTYEFVFRTRFNISAAKLESMTIKNTVEFIGEGVNQSVTSDEVENISFSSSSAGSRIEKELRIRKVDADTKQALEGAKFVLYYQGVECETLRTDEEGWAVFSISSSLDGYTYELVEKEAPDGYKKLEEPKTITINDSSLKTDTATGVRYLEYSIENDALVKTAAINVYKLGDNINQLAGAEFGLYSDADCETLISSKITNDMGMATFFVECGDTATTYYIKEISAPAGYIPTDEVKSVIVQSDGTIIYGSDGNDYVTYNNEKAHAALTLKKVKTGAETVIAGAEFGLYADVNCEDLIETGITNTDGLLVFRTELELGKTYYYRELKAPSGYLLDSTVRSVTFGDGTEHADINKTIIVENAEALGYIKITKTDDAVPANTISGVSFALYDATGTNPIIRNGNAYTVTTDSNGIAVFDQLPYGTYVVKEVAAPEGYVATTDTTVVVNSTGGNEVNIVNKQIKIQVKVKKKDNNDIPLEGVTFAIYKKSTGALIKSGTTDAHGNLVFEDIPYGDYEVRETKGLKGYIKAAGIYEIEKNDIIEDGQEFEWTVVNRKEDAMIQFRKRAVKEDESTPTNYLAGAEFTIYDSDGRALKTAVSDYRGIVTFDHLIFDTYTIKETKAPTDYKLNAEEWYVEVTKNLKYTRLYTVLDNVSMEEIDNEELETGIVYVSFTLEKVDSNDQPLQGAKFEFSKQNPGDTDWTLLSTAYSDVYGMVEFYNITVEGDNEDTKYRIQEVDAPTGYKIDTESCTKEYTYNELTQMQLAGKDMVGHVLKKTNFINVPMIADFENEQIFGTIRVSKTGVLSSNKLQGAEFTLYQKDGVTPYPSAENPYKVVTDVNGIAIFEHLPIGDYVVKESGAPKGYTLNTIYRPFVTIADEEVKTVTFTNTPIRVYVNKQVAGSAQMIAGATLAVYDGATLLESWITTTESHKLNTAEMEVGKTYTLKELKSPSGYSIATEVEFAIEEDGTVVYVSGDGSATGQTVTMVDETLGLYIRKVDADTQSDLSGALLSVIDEAIGTSVYDFTTDGNVVQIPYNKLSAPSEEGTYAYYTIHEKSAPVGYQLAEDIKVAIGYDGTIYLVEGTNMTIAPNPIIMEDEKKQYFYFSKVDAGNSQRLSGALLEIVNADTQMVVETWTSGTSPKQVTGLTAGETYIFREREAPNGYVKADPITFKVAADGTTLSIVTGNAGDLSYDKMTITMRDETVRVKVRKLTENSAILPGAIFELYESNTNKDKVKLLETFTTTEASTVLNYKKLKTNAWYVLVETAAPKGYELAEPEYFYIDDSGVAKNIFGEVYDSNLIEIKDAEKTLSIQKVDAKTNTGLVGVTLCITSTEDVDFETIEWVTDGTARYFNYSLFEYDTKYVLTEVQTLNGYTYADTVEFYIDSENELVYADHVVTTGNRIVIKNTTFELSVDKQDLDTKKSLEGAVLAIRDADGNILEQWTTDGTPHKVDTSKLHVSDNSEMVYTLEEMSAPQYYALAQPISFTINQNGVLKRGDGENTEKNTLIMYDEYCGIAFSKQDNSGRQLPNATITITSIEDTEFEPITFVTTKVPKNLSMDSFKRNTDYIMSEIEAPNGYTYAEDIVFRIDDAGVLYMNGVATTDRTVIMKDNQFEVFIAKREKSEDTLLSGAKMSIVDEATGSVIYSWTTDGKMKKLPSKKLAVSTDKDKIVYILKETKAPDGYELAKNIRFYMDKDGQVYVLKGEKAKKISDNIITMYDEKKDKSVTTTSKKTGDTVPLRAVFGLFLLALTGTGLTISGKKKSRE